MNKEVKNKILKIKQTTAYTIQPAKGTYQIQDLLGVTQVLWKRKAGKKAMIATIFSKRDKRIVNSLKPNTRLYRKMLTQMV
jgi:hypothetical protein